MKMFLATTLLASAAASAVAAGACADAPTHGTRFEDPSPLAEQELQNENACCAACADNTECKAWTFEKAELLRSARCFLHSSDTLPTGSSSGASCATHSPQPPHPPTPSPTPSGKGQNWVVIAAGSKTYGNYRHQADACHAYQVVKAGGVPESNIILMMEDDVANDSENPFPGKMFNKPTADGVPGKDVYDGCQIDYRGSVVTAQLFLDVLQGKADAVNGLGSGKVLKSGPNDKVFINFADHGGTGIIEFPNGDFLHASDLNTALKTMAANKMFSKLVFYMEACESGSMFENLLPTDINVFATTAANAQESSWGTYCPPDDKVNGKELNSCLGDLYSVNWMEDADTQTGRDRTLEGQFEYVKQLTNKSHPQEYGTLSFDSTDHVKDYIGAGAGVKQTFGAKKMAGSGTERNVVDTHDIELLQNFYKYMRASSQGKTAEQTQALADELIATVQARQEADALFAKLPAVVATVAADFEAEDGSPIDPECVKTAYTQFKESCGAFTSYTLQYTHQVADLCTTHTASSVAAILDTLCQ